MLFTLSVGKCIVFATIHASENNPKNENLKPTNKMKKASEKDGLVILPDGTEYVFTHNGWDRNGNRRYLVSWLALGLPKYEATATTREAGLRKFTGKRYGGGFSFQCGGSSSELIKQAEFFHSLGLRRPIEIKETSTNGVAFWIKMFQPRTKKWQRDTLKRLKGDRQVFGSLQETTDKIEALKHLLI